MRIRMTVEDRVAQTIHNSVADDRHMDLHVRRVYQALSDKIGPDRRLIITTRDELEAIHEELLGEIGVCEEILGQGCEDPSEDRDLRLEIARMERSADRCGQILSDLMEEV